MKVIKISVAILLLCATLAFAAEEKVTGSITKITMGTGQATVIVKDSKTGKDVTVTVKDELTLEKLKDKRIVDGDEIRLKYDPETGITTVFRKTAGC